MQSSAVASSSRNPGQPFSPELRARLVTEQGTNAADIFCPLAGCRCLILRKGAAELVKRSAAALAHPSAKPTRHEGEIFPLGNSGSDSGIEGTDADSAPSDIECWLVTSPMTFENVGFTKGVASGGGAAAAAAASGSNSSSVPGLPQGASVRYLACADCDCGPLGYHVELAGRDLGQEVAAEAEGQGRGQVQAQEERGQMQHQREFLLDLQRCRYRLP